MHDNIQGLGEPLFREFMLNEMCARKFAAAASKLEARGAVDTAASLRAQARDYRVKALETQARLAAYGWVFPDDPPTDP